MLLDMPIELLFAIWDELESFSDRNSLVLTCRPFYHTFQNELYHHLIKSESKTRKEMAWTAINGRETCMRKLLEHGADPGDDVPDMHQDHSDDKYLILRPGISLIELEDHTSIWTPLMYATYRGHPGVAKLLIDAGASVNAHGGSDGLPVKLAVFKGHVEVLAILLSAVADPYVNIYGSQTLLTYAAQHGYTKIVRLLLSGSNTVGDRSQISYTPRQLEVALEYAVRCHQKDVVCVFVRAGIDINDPMTSWCKPSRCC